MRKLILAFWLNLFCLAIIIAQAPQKFNYQATLRDDAGNALVSETVSLRLSILQGNPESAPAYVETHNPTTSSYGVVNIQIGDGNSTDDFSSINWNSSPCYLMVEIDPQGGNNFELLGTNELLSVPYALYSNKSGTAESLNESGWKRNVNDLFYNEGKIGIGTNTPSGLLNVYGNFGSGLDRNLLQLNNINESALAYTGLSLKTGPDAGHSVIQNYSMNYTASPSYDFAGFLNVANSNRGVMLHANSPEGVIKFYTGHDANMGAGVERMRIASNGSVGIGTNNPSENNTLTILKQTGSTGTYSRGLAVYVTPLNTAPIGVYAKVYNDTPISSYRTYGIGAEVGNATSGWNYAIYGRILGENNGAAIIGLVSGRSEEDVAGMWAGYFRGNVYVEDNVGIGTRNPKAKLEIADGDIYINDITGGIIMTSPDGQCWRGTLNNSGMLGFVKITCP